jgi:ribose/xylose/arabinose/galactoside ABC-type transport system permease subunit
VEFYLSEFSFNMTLFQGVAIIITEGYPITDLGNKFEFIFYVVCGFLTGLVSLVLSSRISSVIPTMGTGFELQSIAAVVIGGIPLMREGRVGHPIFAVIIHDHRRH